jgi:hypothetical protein
MQWAMLLQDLQPLLQYLAGTIITAQIMTRLIAAVLQSWSKVQGQALALTSKPLSEILL